MIPCKPVVPKLILLALFFVVFSTSQISAQDGKALFQSKCASCHNPLKDGTGPALAGLEDRHTWADHKELLKWINNPGGYMATDPYTTALKNARGTVMTAFPEITLKDVD